MIDLFGLSPPASPDRVFKVVNGRTEVLLHLLGTTNISFSEQQILLSPDNKYSRSRQQIFLCLINKYSYAKQEMSGLFTNIFLIIRLSFLGSQHVFRAWSIWKRSLELFRLLKLLPLLTLHCSSNWNLNLYLVSVE